MSTCPESELLIKLANLQTRLQKQLSGALTPHGISFTEYLVLYQLNQAPGKTMRRIDLAEKVGLSASGVTRLLNPMQKIGLVQKEENARDARVSLVALTRTGNSVFQEAETAFNQAAEALLKSVDGKVQAALSGFVSALL